MGPRPSKDHRLDRIENNDKYSGENCRWATIQEQNQNRRNNVLNEQLVKFILWEQKVNNCSLDEIYDKMPSSYTGLKSTIGEVFHGRTWTNINIDKEIEEYLNMKGSE